MTHKEQCICYCIDYLNQRNSAFAFSFETFSHYYRKHNGAWGNAYHIGLSAGDMMMENFKPQTQEVKNERGNEGQEAAPAGTF